MTTLTLSRPLHNSPATSRVASAVAAPAPMPLTGLGQSPFAVVGALPAGPDGRPPVVFRGDTGSDATLLLAAARADVVRVGFSSDAPDRAAMAALVAEVEEEVAAVGRRRADVTVLLDVEVVVVADEAAAQRKSQQLACLDAMAGVAWPVAATRVVATADQAPVVAARLAQEVGADGAYVIPLAGSADLLAAVSRVG
ncbi:LLM class flavin-dependent oxidoreductase [Cellulomonas cellasea]|uniref:LLM class flavin-dependent oxidoreductase n=1 Tax=Cellulomonas cellasea TaxID=43670 RepID=UPI0025A336BC|nr:LLM class flavin-dependent oxidoreductase [Cellulomonas cellasea]MDM8084410.1 LLM class flavin-dependent oxidoreductase [Cellulomonas cellasea]